MPKLRNCSMLFGAALGGAIIGAVLVWSVASEPPRPIYFAEDCSPPLAI